MVDFLEEDDRTVFGTCDRNLQSTETGCLYHMADLVNINVINSFPTLQQLHAYLDRLDLLDSEHLRPSWDSYFMVSPVTSESSHHQWSRSSDVSLSGFSSIQLHEAACGCNTCSTEPCSSFRLQWYTSWLEELHRRGMLPLQSYRQIQSDLQRVSLPPRRRERAIRSRSGKSGKWLCSLL